MKKMESLFKKAFGDNPKTRVLEFMLESKDKDYSISDIAEGAGIGRTTLFRIWQDLMKTEIIKQTRNIGNAKLFRLNTDNSFVRKLIGIFDELTISSEEKEKGKEKATVFPGYVH